MNANVLTTVLEADPREEQAETAESVSNLDFAYQKLRSAILLNEFEPGTVISQVKLADRLAVSRTPLREALRLLEKEGLVESKFNRRVTIAKLSIRDLEELYALRITLEALAIRLSVPLMTQKDVAALDKLLHRMADYQKSGDLENWKIRHRDFHRALVKHAGERQVRLLSEMSDHAERYRLALIKQMPRAWGDGEAEHALIVAACRRGDPQGAAEALAKHLARTALSIIAHEAPDHEPTAVRTAVKAVTGQK